MQPRLRLMTRNHKGNGFVGAARIELMRVELFFELLVAIRDRSAIRVDMHDEHLTDVARSLRLYLSW